MKNLARVLVVTLALVAVMGFAVFAEEGLTAKERAEQLKEEGYERSEIVEILKSEGYELNAGPLKTAVQNLKDGFKVEFSEDRMAIIEKFKALKADGLEMEAIIEQLTAEGFDLSAYNFVRLDPEMSELVKGFRAEGLSREEIKEKLADAGYTFEKPELSEEKKAELAAIRELVDTWKEEGLDRKEIFEKLVEAGYIDESQVKFTQVTNEMKEKIDALKAQGFTRQEIKENLE